ncbi:MAG: peptide ABC transporter substrate-binding protein [Vampirovibrionales bacterium]|nr:peptide ABC transporter substrate-binding protein [Vampirovibrionales bacterium]
MAIGWLGCNDSDPKSTHKTPSLVFKVNLGTEPPTLDPARATDLTSFTVLQAIQKGLVQLNERMEPVPAVAQRWTISSDRRTYTFFIHPKALWSDGKPVLAKHFADAWQRALTPETGSEYAFFLYEIAGAEAFYDGQSHDKTSFKSVSVKVLGPKTLQVTLKRPVPFFLSLMASPVALPLRLDQLKRDGDAFTEAGKFITNGPFLLSQWKHDSAITLKPNLHYWLGVPKTSIELVMVPDANTSVAMYETDQLDMIETTTSLPSVEVRRLKHSPEAHQLPLYHLNYLGFNTQHPVVRDVRVRQALALSIDRQWIPQLMQGGQQPNTTVLMPGLFGYNPHLGLAFNPQKAQKLLAEAGYPNGKGFPELSLAYRSGFDTRREMEILQFLWKKHLNITVRLENLDWKMFLHRLKTNPPALYRLGWFADYPDPDTFVSLFTRANGNNYSHWWNPTYEAGVIQAATLPNGFQRQQVLNALQRQLLEQDAVMIPLYTGTKMWLVQPCVSGFTINPMNLMDFQKVSVKKAADCLKR